ncbi:PTS sugar transporter [Citrobacter sp. NCU1]|uniref:PTS system mannose/fructose/N-acetylgalactosamine-transporter subunit IIB n=1 Tax=Citrobacter sp. NCU1 TaxID=2026683 RepID=UPI001390E65D|nr:PTS sugar transporter subunit IIB [Citrobacter sp. NCU1]NDO79771.1 PTS sugar transporter [Citrobacter sp. NCU1]
MPIIHFRVDSRLIHGQVALAWSKMTNPNHIIVANDTVAKDVTQQAVLKLAAPKQVRLSMVEIDRVKSYIKRGLQENENVFLLVQNVIDASKFFDDDFMYRELNIGNMVHKTNSQKLNDRLFVSDNELSALKSIISKDVNCYFQVLPNDSKQDMKLLLQKNGLL